MTGYLIDTPAAQDIAGSSVSPKVALGSWALGSDGLYQYVRANGATLAGGFVTIDETFDATPQTSTTSGSLVTAVGIADQVFADNYYFWAWRGGGVFEALVANGVTAGQLTTTGTAQTAGTGGDNILNLRNVDTGVTSTRVTVFAAGIMSTNANA